MAWILGAWKATRLFVATYKVWLMIGVAVTIMGGITLYVWSAERAKGRVAELEAQAKGWDAAVTTLMHSLENNKNALVECEATNEQNTAEVARLGVALDKAEARVTLLDERATDSIEGFEREANAIRNTDPTCRTLDDALPDSFIGGVRRPATADPH
jgi:hypothetical protein